MGESSRGCWHLPELRGTHQHHLASCVCNLHSGMVLLSCPRCGQVQLRHWQQTLAASMLCPWSASTLGAWLPPPRFRRTGPTTCGATGLGLSLLPSFPSLLFELGVCVLCPSYHFVFWKHMAGLASQTHSWGMCLRMNLTLSLAYI